MSAVNTAEQETREEPSSSDTPVVSCSRSNMHTLPDVGVGESTASNTDATCGATSKDTDEDTDKTDDYLSNEVRPTPNIYIEYKLHGVWRQAKVLSQQPRSTSKFSGWLNIYNRADRKPSSVNWQEVSVWKQIESPEQPVYLCEDEELSQDVVDAKEKELKNLDKNDVFQEVEYCGQHTISSRWVITSKWIKGMKSTKA